jgi:ABC-type multidrug transport system ATPase subunit
VRLSGGQRQRIGIARAFLKRAPILLLDEATSALASEVEAAIQASLYSLMEGKTVVAIAHRLSTIAAMDRLIVLDQGRVVEEGDHRSLLERGGLYARLWAHQSGGFLGEVEEGAAFDSGVAETVWASGAASSPTAVVGSSGAIGEVPSARFGAAPAPTRSRPHVPSVIERVADGATAEPSDSTELIGPDMTMERQG